MYVQAFWFSSCVLISSCATVGAADFSEFAGNDVMQNHVTDPRWRRSVPGEIGSALVRAIMKGTVEVKTSSPRYRKFFKQGSEYDAIDDFNGLNSRVTMSKSYGATGYVGKTRFHLTIKDKTNSWLPTLKISDPSMSKQIKIIYLNRPLKENYKKQN